MHRMVSQTEPLHTPKTMLNAGDYWWFRGLRIFRLTLR